MKNTNIFFFFMLTLSIMQIHCDSVGLQAFQNNNQSPPLTVDSLTLQSYISPKMQWAVLSLFDKPAFFEINKITGIAQGIPTVAEMLLAIDLKLLRSSRDIHKESIQYALQAMLEATDIALSFVAIKTAYQDPIFMPCKDTLIKDLDHQKVAIQNMLDKLHKVRSDTFRYVFSWMYNRYIPIQKNIPEHEKLIFDNTETTIKIPAMYMNSIIQNNDYKEFLDVSKAANILCKQCFFAQQPYNNVPIISLNLQNHLSVVDYIFCNVPDIYDKYSGKYPMCEYLQSLDQNSKLQLLYLRQVIQTAISVVHAQATVNARYFLPVHTLVDLHSLVRELMKYDAHVSALCAEQKMDNLVVLTKWSMTSKVIIGLVVAAIVGRIIYVYNPDILPTVVKKKSDFIHWLSRSPVSEELEKNKEVNDISEFELSKKKVNSENRIDTSDNYIPDEVENASEKKHDQQKPTSNAIQEKTIDQLLENRTWREFFTALPSHVTKELGTYYQSLLPRAHELDVDQQTDWGAQSEREDKEEVVRQQESRERQERMQMDQADRESRAIEEDIPPLEFIPEVKIEMEREQSIADVNNWAQSMAQNQYQESPKDQDKQLPPVRFSNMQGTCVNQDAAAILPSNITEREVEKEQALHHANYWFRRINEGEEGYFSKIPALPSQKITTIQAQQKEQIKAVPSIPVMTQDSHQIKNNQPTVDNVLKNELPVASISHEQVCDIAIDVDEISFEHQAVAQERPSLSELFEPTSETELESKNILAQGRLRQSSLDSGIADNNNNTLDQQAVRRHSLDSSKSRREHKLDLSIQRIERVMARLNHVEQMLGKETKK